MKKIAVFLLTALMLSTTAFAADDMKTDAGVRFIEAKGPGIVDPGPEDKTIIEGIATKAFHFGTRERYKVNTTIYSNDTKIISAGVEKQISDKESLEAEPLRKTGLVVENEKPNANWSVTAAVGPFMAGGKQTMKNFELVLSPVDEIKCDGQENGPRPVANSNRIKANGLQAGTAQEFFKSGKNANPQEGDPLHTIGTWGVNFDGALDIVGNSVVHDGKDDVAAVINWAITIKP